ncbi:hypothetical protein CcaverHIS002_0507670 [Cutaneotrichosporon cavernicola]|uniref:Nudix hydrolase domain-containing protein n=1 Tax=Cutaneotrichosporon cavernicola TaxID=279322 RepID=A0AA48QXB5_9TREE|nr:uncharacterized protein CcaverHIS019_0508230 [Cutaneotrichosporon cavernicola]BEI85366.1 hypothetical protein CcaverHIS002_0507670 [Cutaneotrichosporon cavernicola]BEI93195.1 hypothetical protein CcaverHIS019_0508230 [Cutaneotrichosporon cavernicola]BEJ00972.1 hypothetical protein CcaverHIS631_0508290 [Cutaneotrichosporon cavernicola]BEJ08737.1 hypothetical protein CcaverHIS641_0508310 [Cutaneotrichosporon cavernicola]
MKQTPRHVAVAIPFCPATHRVLLITSRKHPNLWILPKGGVDNGETSGQAAAREAQEEGGLPIPHAISDELNAHQPLAPPGKRQEIWHAHALEMASEDLDAVWLEQGQRERGWFTAKEVIKALEKWGPLVEGEGDMSRGAPKKKAIKSDAMLRAFRAFLLRYGWET